MNFKKSIKGAVAASLLATSVMIAVPSTSYASDVYVCSDKMNQTFWVMTETVHRSGNTLKVTVKKVGHGRYGQFTSFEKFYFTGDTYTTNINSRPAKIYTNGYSFARQVYEVARQYA